MGRMVVAQSPITLGRSCPILCLVQVRRGGRSPDALQSVAQEVGDPLQGPGEQGPRHRRRQQAQQLDQRQRDRRPHSLASLDHLRRTGPKSARTPRQTSRNATAAQPECAFWRTLWIFPVYRYKRGYCTGEVGWSHQSGLEHRQDPLSQRGLDAGCIIAAA